MRCKWLHSELDAIERMQVLRELREGSLRRAGRRQPPARGARFAGSVAGRHPRRRQGRLSAQRDVADPDHRPGRPQRQRRGDPVRRQGDRFHAAGHGRDRTPPRSCNWTYNAEHGITPETRAVGHQHGHRGGDRGPPVRGGRWRARTTTSRRNTSKSCTAKCWRRPPTWSSSGQLSCATKSPSSKASRPWRRRQKRDAGERGSEGA